MKRKLNLHPSKVWAFLYPIYAKEAAFGNGYDNKHTQYEHLAGCISKDFILTPEQWEAVLQEWEFIHEVIYN